MRLFLFFLCLQIGFFAQASTLTLQDYLQQVEAKHEGYRSATKSTEAANLELRESHLLTEPNFFANAQYTDDRRPNPLYSIQDTITNNYQVGLSDATSFGLYGRLYYAKTDLQYVNFGFPGSPLLNESQSQSSPTLELTLPLWRNWMGAEINSQVEAGAANAEAKLHSQKYALKMVLTQAETAYWVLNLAQLSVRVAKDSVERAQQLVDWNYHKSKIGLADDAEYLQAQAAHEARVVDLKNTQNDLVTASRNFNSLREQDSTDVAEELTPLTADSLRQISVPVRRADREDVQSALARSKAARANAELSRQKYLPTFELFGTAASNNPSPLNTSTAWTDSFDSSRPTSSIGLRLTAPLDFNLVGQIKRGYDQDKLAADLDYQRKKFEQDVDWNNLVDRYAQTKTMLDLYEKLEKVQLSKLDHERLRRSKGRTTTQQVLNFELDYEQAQFLRLHSMSDLLQIISQMKLYEGDSPESR